jgi:hypothetical protein
MFLGCYRFCPHLPHPTVSSVGTCLDFDDTASVNSGTVRLKMAAQVCALLLRDYRIGTGLDEKEPTFDSSRFV